MKIELQQALDSVKKTELTKGTILTDDHIAMQVGILPDQLQAYLKATEPTPEELPKTILEAFGHKIVTVTVKETNHFRRPPEEENG